MLRPGLVIEIFDPRTRPPKNKWHICICDSRHLFLRINSRPLWPPSHPISASLNGFLAHDSYVELRELFHFSHDAVASALRAPKNPLGILTKDEARNLALAVRSAVTISEELQDLVWRNLTSPPYF